MKKIYVNPQIEVISFKAQNLLAGSSYSVGFGASVANTDGAESHGDDADWGDDEY